MKNVVLFFFFFCIINHAQSQNRVIVSLVSEFEGKVIKIYSDTMKARLIFNLTGFESVSDVVLNVIAVQEDGSETRKVFEVLHYDKNQNITEVKVKTDEGESKYVFMRSENILITQDKKGNIMWEGDIIF
jgi:hypothetical protein